MPSWKERRQLFIFAIDLHASRIVELTISFHALVEWQDQTRIDTSSLEYQIPST